MEKKGKILTQEEYMKIKAEISRLTFEQTLTGKDNSARIKKLKARIEE